MEMDRDAFERLVGAQAYKERKLMPLEIFRERLRAAMAEEGYESREDIIALVNEIKREQANGIPLDREDFGEEGR